MFPNKIQSVIRKDVADIRHVYFAHSIRHYGSRLAEQARNEIRSMFSSARLHCPETMQERFSARTSKGLADSYRSVLRYCLPSDGAVVLTEFNGKVGRGVYEEVCIAELEMQVPTWILRGGIFLPLRQMWVIDKNNWIEYGRVHGG